MKDSTLIKGEIRNFILKSSYLPEDKVKNDTLIFVNGILDSMGFITLINYLEESFSLIANDDELIETNFESVNAIADFVARKLHAEKVLNDAL